MRMTCGLVICLTFGICYPESAATAPVDWTTWKAVPEKVKPAAPRPADVSLTSADWGFLRSTERYDHVEFAVTLQIDQPAKSFRYFGESWNVWPDPTVPDQGFEAGILIRGSETSGYRVQVSHKYQEVALVKYPHGGYVASVPCPIKLKEPIRVVVTARSNRVTVSVNGENRVNFIDRMRPLDQGSVGIGVSSGSAVRFTEPKLLKLASDPPVRSPAHKSAFAVRDWLGGRPWLFDGAEPIAVLPIPNERTVNCVKLRPGFKPLLSWNSHWGIENQGAFPEGESRNSAITVTGKGESATIAWTARNVKDNFTTRTAMVVSYDAVRDAYAYEVDSTLEVTAKQAVPFRYGFDFEHHTPLDPFRWKYIAVKRTDGRLHRRPLSPFDPGTMEDVELYRGLRLWHGRTDDVMEICPAVEYLVDPTWNKTQVGGKESARSCNTAVCAAFYDTGVSYGPESAAPGTRIRVKYRYTGLPPEEAGELMARSVVHDNPRNDPGHHFIFVGEQWPTIEFAGRLGMDQPWWGGRPFMSGHNARPTYASIKTPGIGSGWAMRIGPEGYAVAALPAPTPLPKGRYLVTAHVRGDNLHGPGGRIEVLALQKGDVNGYVRGGAKILREESHHAGNGNFEWKRISFVTEVPSGAPAVALGLGNAGTGDFDVASVNFRKLEDLETIPPHASAKAVPAARIETVPGCLWDFRMQEQRGSLCLNYGANSYRTLEVCNADWVVDEGRPSLKFADNPKGRRDYRKLGALDNWVRHPVYGKTYEPVSHHPLAVAGHHGGGFEVKALTVSAWIKPAARVGADSRTGTGDIAGIGARRFILSLRGPEAPYQLEARLNVNDRIVTKDRVVAADRWQHSAMTAETEGGKWRIRLYLDGKLIGDGLSEKMAAPATIPPSVILGAELFYLHDAYYRGLIGRTMIFDRALTADEIAKWAQEK